MTKILVLTSLLDTYRLRETLSPFFAKFPDIVVDSRLQDCDYGISFLNLKKIPQSALRRAQWINFHPGPLPEYKGRNLAYHAIMNGEEYFGASVHYVDENFDTGPIISVMRFPIFDFDTAETVNSYAVDCCYELLKDWFEPFVSGEELPSDENVGGHYYQKEPINDYLEVDEFTKRRIRAITFKQYYPKIEIGLETYKIVPE